MTLTPAYGKDYKNKREVLEAFDADKDFVINDIMSPDNGRYCNKRDLVTQGIKTVNIRYKKLTQVAVVKVK